MKIHPLKFFIKQFLGYSHEKKTKLYFKLFASCIPVKGKTRSIIYDLERFSFELIPNSLCEILCQHETCDISQLTEIVDIKQKSILQDYLDFLISNEIGFYLNKDEINRFPKLNLEFDFPSFISNLIIDVDKGSDYDIIETIHQLDKLNCFHLQVRFFNKIDIEHCFSPLNNRTQL